MNKDESLRQPVFRFIILQGSEEVSVVERVR
jgi:hypothetical protein